MAQRYSGHGVVTKSVDYLIVGGGIVGLTVARELRQRYPAASIVLLEKEAILGKHASGRNSGVLHSGIYYDSGTLKAKVCAAGARRMKTFAAEYGINCQHSGKVIVATTQQDLPVIDRLLNNAQNNGILAARLDEQGVRDIEPHAGVYQQGIHCLDTAVIDSKAVLSKLQELLAADGVEIIFQALVTFINVAVRKVITPAGEFSYGYLFNCAGASADKVAKYYGLGLDYALAFFFGTLPMALTRGAGAGAQNAIGTAVTGGLLSATFIDLIFIPFFFVLISRLFGKQQPATDPPQPATVSNGLGGELS